MDEVKLTVHEHRRISEICDEFESGTETGPAAVMRRVNAWEDCPVRFKLAEELITSDLERILRTKGGPSGAPIVGEYRNQITELGDSEAYVKLLHREFALRSQCGTPPSIADYLAWPGVEGLSEHALHQTLDQIHPIQMSICARNYQAMRCWLNSAVIFGRQHGADPRPISTLKYDGHQRVIVSDERVVSREQLRLSRVKLGQVKVENIGSKLDVTVDDVTLAPAESLTIESGSKIAFFDVSIAIVGDF